MNEYAKEVASNVDKYGFHVTYVSSSDTPPFCYSTGLWRTHGIPELFISALPPQLSHELVGQYARRHSQDGPPFNERIAAVDERFDYYLIKIPKVKLAEYTLATIKFYGPEHYEYAQLIFPDTEMRFPDEPGYEYDQEILGEFPPPHGS